MNYYFIGLGVTLTLLLIWFYSPLRSSIGWLVNKNINSNSDFETWLLLKTPFLGKLLGCYICCSFWLSLIIGLLFWYFFKLSLCFPILTWLTYPSLAYLYKTIIDKNK